MPMPYIFPVEHSAPDDDVKSDPPTRGDGRWALVCRGAGATAATAFILTRPLQLSRCPSAANRNCLSSFLVAAIESAWFVPRSGYARPRNNGGFKFGAVTAQIVENRFTGGSPSLSSTTMTDSIPGYAAVARPEGLGIEEKEDCSPPPPARPRPKSAGLLFPEGDGKRQGLRVDL